MKEVNDNIFISYSKKDGKYLDTVFSSLKNQNYHLFIRNEKENNEEKYSKYIEPLINSKLFIGFLTQNYISDDYCYGDLILCKNNRISLIMVLYEDINVEKFIQNLELVYAPVIFNVSDDTEHFQNGYGLNFAKFKAQIDRFLDPSKSQKPIEIPPPKPPSKPPLKPPPIPSAPQPNASKPSLPFKNVTLYNNKGIETSRIITNNNIDEEPLAPEKKLKPLIIIDKNAENIHSNNNNSNKMNELIYASSANNLNQEILDINKIFEDKTNIPECHFNCRFDSKSGGSKLFTRTTNISVSKN